MCLHDRSRAAEKLDGEVLVEQLFLYQQPDNASSEHIHHGIQSAEREVEERSFVVKASLQHDRVEVRIEPQHVAVGLMSDDHSGHQGATCRLRVELGDECEDEPRYRGE